jgi:amino acid transporter
MWLVFFVAVTALTNFFGVDVTATLNKYFLYIQLAILAVFLCWAAVLVMQDHAQLTLDPFHPQGGAPWSVVAGAIPMAAFSFLGFDAVSTLNEEAKGAESGVEGDDAHHVQAMHQNDSRDVSAVAGVVTH